MSVLKKQNVREDIEAAFNDLASYLEEDRIYPSVREAGTAPSDIAIEKAYTTFKDTVVFLLKKGVTEADFTEITFDEILAELNSHNDENVAEKINDLKEIDSFVRDNGESKYRYVNTVYEHTPTKRFICVEEQRGVGNWEYLTSSVTATEAHPRL